MKMNFRGFSACSKTVGILTMSLAASSSIAGSALAFEYGTEGIQNLPRPAEVQEDSLRFTQSSASLGSGASVEDGGLFTAPENRRGQPSLSPSVGIEWFSIDGAERAGRRARATWMGARAGVDARVYHLPVADFGIKGTAFRSAAPLTTDARGGSVTELQAMGYGSFHANSESFGIPTLSLSLGYAQNRRRVDGGYAIVSPVSGLKYGADLSFTLERTFNLGVNAAMNDGVNGVAEFGGYLMQRISGDGLRARIGFSVSQAKEIFRTETLRENWSQVSFGLIGTL